MNHYSFQVFWSEEDGNYIAIVPEFRSVSAFGDTPEEALSAVQIALEMVIEDYEEEGWPLPEPQTLTLA
jgi:predicted RNase H-like HicB family nuclease